MKKLHEYLPGDCRERIQDLLRERGMTQSDLAEKIGISGGALNRYISGETDKIAAENIVKIARVFGVSTDFLLCETNIPYRTNYDIEELGLTAKAAARLYTGEVDPAVVSQLLEHKEFAILVTQIAQFKDATVAAGIAGMNTMIGHLSSLAQRVGKKNPRLQRAAFCTQQNIEAIAAAGDIPLVPPATMSPTYEQGQVRDAIVTHLPLFCCHQKALCHNDHTPFRCQRSQKV